MDARVPNHRGEQLRRLMRRAPRLRCEFAKLELLQRLESYLPGLTLCRCLHYSPIVTLEVNEVCRQLQVVVHRDS